ncbi:MAG TPA: ATP-binding cassette domain-containing protein [Gammaproteobacteria bacterium]|nr:ATP-binding cassette domain-containing protein [Gammaproteobacteria bacterium]
MSSTQGSQFALRLKDVSFISEGRTIISSINMDINKGQIVAIVGPSGAGKTTLLKILTGLMQSSSGTVEILGSVFSKLSYPDQMKIRRRMGILFQQGGLQNQLNVFENVAFPLRQHFQLAEDYLETLVLNKLEAVGLKQAADLMPEELSGGMMRRVALSRAIVMDPEILIYDEPFVGQDPISSQVLVNLIRKMNELPGVTSVIVSHDIELVLELADMIYFVADGVVIVKGSAEVIEGSSHPWVRQFLDGDVDGPMPFHYSKFLQKDVRGFQE